MDVQLTEAGGAFEFRGMREGVPCTGSVGVNAGFGSRTVFVSDRCGWPTEGEELVRACEENLSAAPCEDAELALFDGTRGLTRDRARAAVLATRACDAGRAHSCSNAAVS